MYTNPDSCSFIFNCSTTAWSLSLQKEYYKLHYCTIKVLFKKHNIVKDASTPSTYTSCLCCSLLLSDGDRVFCCLSTLCTRTLTTKEKLKYCNISRIYTKMKLWRYSIWNQSCLKNNIPCRPHILLAHLPILLYTVPNHEIKNSLSLPAILQFFLENRLNYVVYLAVFDSQISTQIFESSNNKNWSVNHEYVN